MKKLLYVFLAMTVAFGMISCGGDDDVLPPTPVVVPPSITGVTITSGPIVVEKGETPTYVAVVAGTNGTSAAFDSTVTWSVAAKVNATNIAGVTIDPDSGVLTIAATAGVTEGTVLVVTATANGDNTKKATRDVTVFNAGNKPLATSVTVDPSTASVIRGTDQTFTATVVGTNVDDYQDVEWSVAGAGASAVPIHALTTVIDGVLTVAGNENNDSLTVTATALLAGANDAVIKGTAAVTVTGDKTNVVPIRFYDYQNGSLIKTIQIEPEQTIDDAGKTLAKVPNRGEEFRFNHWESQYGETVTVNSSFYGATNVWGVWDSGVFTGSLAGVLEKVYVEDTALPLYQFDISALVGADKTYATVLELMEDIKSIDASYGVSAAAIAAGAPRLRLFGPYFFNETATVLTEKSANNPIGTSFFGDLKADRNGKLVARLEGSASLPETFNKFQPYLLNGAGDSWGGDTPTANSWFTRSIAFDYDDDGSGLGASTPNHPAYSWAKTLRWLVGEDHDGTFFEDGLVGATQVVPTDTDFTKVYFGVGLMRANAGKVVNTTSSVWDHGRVYLVKDVKLVVGKEAANPAVVNGTVPSLSVPSHNYILDDDSTVTLDAITNTKQVFAGYINPVEGSWRGASNESVEVKHLPGWVPPVGGLPEASTHETIDLTPANILLYFGGDNGEDEQNNNGKLVKAEDGTISVNVNVPGSGDGETWGGGITFALPAEWVALMETYSYDAIRVYYTAVIDSEVSGSRAQFATKSGKGKFSPNLSVVGGNAWPSITNGNSNFTFAAETTTIGTDPDYGLSFQINNYASDNIPQKYTIKFTRVRLLAP